MNNDNLNFSTDLLRISRWINEGRDRLADEFLDRCANLYKTTNRKHMQMLEEIRSRIPGREKSAELALTLSRILFYKGAGK